MNEFEQAACEKLAAWSDHINARMGTTLRMAGPNLCLASRAGVKIVVSPVPDAEEIWFTAVLVEPPMLPGQSEGVLRTLQGVMADVAGWFAVEPVTQAICWHYRWCNGLSLSAPEFHALVSAFALKADALWVALSQGGGSARH